MALNVTVVLSGSPEAFMVRDINDKCE